jgi:hypothetical protein
MDLREAISSAVEAEEKKDDAVVDTSPAQGDLFASSGDAGGGADTSSTATTSSGDDKSGSSEVSDVTKSSDADSAGTKTAETSDKSDTEPTGSEKSDGGVSDATAKKAESELSSENDADDGAGGRFRVDRAPQAWKGDVREKWSDLPLNVRSEIVRRERAFDSAMRESAGARDFAVKFQQLVDPHKNQFPGGNVVQGVKSLLVADQLLSSKDKKQQAQAAAKLLASYNVDINALDEALASDPVAAAGNNPVVAAVREELNRRLPQQQPVQQYQQPVADDSALEQTLTTMAKDTKNYEFFFDVIDDMADIMELSARRGVALTPQQAYSRAVNSNPDLASIVDARNAERLKREAAQKLNEQAAAAKKAAVSVSGAQMGKPTTQVSGNSVDLRGTISAAMDQLATGSGRI